MPLPSQPLKAIFPIVSVTEKAPKPLYSFLGTGFFIDADGTFLTAKHIFPSADSVKKYDYNAIMFHLQPNQLSPCSISELEFSQQFDIALGHVEGIRDIQTLNLASKNSPMNFDILTLEFSRTHSKQREDGELLLVFESCYRKGHVMRYYESDYPESIPTQCLELSFPALKGASGAPVIVESDGSVVGMIVQNIGRELLPAQIESVTELGKYTEQIKYYLPNGKAISWFHLAQFVESVHKQLKPK